MAISGQWAVIDTAHTPVARVAAKTLRKRLEGLVSKLPTATTHLIPVACILSAWQPDEPLLP